MRRLAPADPLCSGLLRLPHVHLTIVDGFADPSPTRDSNACRRIVGRGLAAAVDAGLAEGRGRMSAAVRRRRRRKSAVRQGAWRRRSGSRNRRCKLGRELSESRCPWSAQGVEGPATPGLTDDDGTRMRQPELLGCARGRGRKQGPPARIFGASPHRSLSPSLVVGKYDDTSMCYVLPRGADGGRSSISVQEAGGMRWELMPGTRNVVRFPVELVEADERSVAKRCARRAGSQPGCGGVRARRASDGGPKRVGPSDGGADRRDDLLAGGRKGEESGARGDAETARRAGDPDAPRGPRGGLAIGRCGREVRERRARGRLLAKPLKDASDYRAMELARRLIEAYAAAEVA